MSQFFAALGIHGASKGSGRELADHFKSIDGIRTAKKEDLATVTNMGDITAESVCKWFADNSANLDRLLKHVKPSGPKMGKLSGQVFCFSGAVDPDKDKDYWEKVVSDLGAKVVSSVSKKVTFLVYGAGSGLKSEKADELGIPRITIDKLKKML